MSQQTNFCPIFVCSAMQEVNSKLLASFGISDRVQWNSDQVAVLRAHYDQNPYPSRSDKEGLALKLGNCTAKHVNNWFYWRRQSERKAGAAKRN